MKIIGCLLCFLLTNSLAKGQGQVPFCKVYSLEKPDGTVYIAAENRGAMPFTVSIRAKLVNMRSSIPLPLRLVVLPSEKTYLLTTFTPERAKPWSYNYTYFKTEGIYTGHLPDTSYIYRLPYQPSADTVLPSKAKVTNNSNHYLYAFRLPENTPICAARAGTIVAIKQQAEHFKNVSDNLIFVQHSDGGYASYNNIRRNSVVGHTGRQVYPGDTIGYFGGNKLNSKFWFGIYYPGDSLTMTVPVVFRVGKRTVRPLEGKYSIHLNYSKD